ncbi:MAG: PEP/pyruvate-binding domain-containing protein [Candidatus Nanopelagicales bacterium]
MSVVMWFESYWPGMKNEVGGKAASLGEMTGAGLPVPPGYAVTTAGYRAAHDAADLDATLARLLHGLDIADTGQVSAVCSEIREEIRGMPLPADVEDEIRSAYATLCRKCEVEDLPVAVRSSATSEDSPDASFAGEHDTYLWIRGADAVVDAVRRCWASLFTDRATCYRVEMGYEHRSVEMAVVVQKMVRPVSAGVAFTLNPANGDRSQVAVDAAWGFGEAVVSGEVTPDNFLVDKVMLAVSKREISHKAHEYRLTDHDSVEKAEVDPDRADAPCLTDAHLKAIAVLAKTAEKHYGCPQDIEWAVDADLPEGENVILLQARPETVWSKKPRESVTGSADKNPMSSIVSTLMNPLYARDK